MILVLGGTTETAPIAAGLAEKGHEVLVSNSTDAPFDVGSHSNIRLRTGELCLDEFCRLIDEGGVTAVVDATHPYAVQVSEMAIKGCGEKGVVYFRYERPGVEVDGEDVSRVSDHETAALKACELGKVILLTTGSRNLGQYVEAAKRAGCELYARVLDCEESFRLCREAGIAEEHVIAGRGPFSREANEEAIRSCGAEVLVTKDSGTAGGLMEKVQAARACACRIVLVERPVLDVPGRVYNNVTELLADTP